MKYLKKIKNLPDSERIVLVRLFDKKAKYNKNGEDTFTLTGPIDSSIETRSRVITMARFLKKVDEFQILYLRDNFDKNSGKSSLDIVQCTNTNANCFEPDVFVDKWIEYPKELL